MKLLYELRVIDEITVIDLAPHEWTPIHPWPIRLAWVLWGLWLVTVTVAGQRWLRLKQTFCTGRDAIRIVATVSRVGARVITDDMAYRLGRVIVGDRLERLCLV